MTKSSPIPTPISIAPDQLRTAPPGHYIVPSEEREDVCFDVMSFAFYRGPVQFHAWVFSPEEAATRQFPKDSRVHVREDGNTVWVGFAPDLDRCQEISQYEYYEVMRARKSAEKEIVSQ